jgi:hypothetical protein
MGLSAAITLVLSLYGAALATYIGARGLRRDRKVLVVTCGLGYRPSPDDGGAAVQVVTIEATNTGTRPIEIRGAGFVRAEDGEHIERTAFAVEPSLPPLTLADGSSARFSYPTTADVSRPGSTFEVWRVYVRTSPDGVWFGQPDDWLQPLWMSRTWWGSDADALRPASRPD